MQNGYYQATAGMVTQLNRLNVISNNLANLNTAGFKSDDVVIADYKRLFEEHMKQTPIKDNTKDAAKYINQTLTRMPNIDITYSDFSQGALKYTNNSLDLALQKSDLFFMVQASDGSVKFTKNGSFSIDDEGYLVTKNGERILSNSYFDDPANSAIAIDDNALITVDSNGNIYQDGQLANSLFIAKVDDVRALRKVGDNLYKLDDLTTMQNTNESNSVRSGYLEMSNVNAVTQMSELIETHRLVEAYQKVMTSHMDDLNQEAINKLASTK